MKLLIITDAWHPQVNGVVRTMEATVAELIKLGHQVLVVGPEHGFFSMPAPTYPEILFEFFAEKRLKKVLDDFHPDYIHISTEGPLGMAMRHVCMREKRPYSTAYHTCFPEYLERRAPFPLKKTVKLLTYQWMKRLHVPSGAVMVSTPSIEANLRKHRIRRIRRWSRGVDTNLFKPYGKTLEAYRNLPRPIFLYVGRVAVEKNLSAFLDLDLPGSKVVIGDGPQEQAFRQKYKDVHFLGKKSGEELARHYAAADVFVFPSKTDTFGLVLLEAVASGLAVAAYPVQGPIDVFADKGATAGFAVLDNDLGAAALKAASLPVDEAARHAYVQQTYSWEACTRQFLANLQSPTPYALRRIRRFRRALEFINRIWWRLKWAPKLYPALYRLLTFCIGPFLPFYLSLRAKRGKEDPARLPERFGHASRARPPGKLIWLHAASVGEALSLLPLMKRLLLHSLHFSLLLTTGTRSAAALLATRLPEGVIHQYIPVDTPVAMQRFFDHWRPDFVLLVESELWPTLLAKIRKLQIPAALINARMSKRSAENWSHFASLWIASLLGSFQLVLAQSEGDAQRLQALGAYNATCVGNLKTAAEPLPYDPQEYQKLAESIKTRPVWLMASTHEGEEELALQTHQELRSLFPGLLTVLVPRHPARAKKILQLIRQRGLNVAMRSANEPIQQNTEFYLADTFGELGLFYRLVPLVVIGGSFGKAGGHNPLEAASFGATILFGSDMRNFTEIANHLALEGGAIQLNQHALAATIARLLEDEKARIAMGEKAKQISLSYQHVLDHVMAALQPFFLLEN